MSFILKTYSKYAQFLLFLPTESQRTLRVPEKRPQQGAEKQVYLFWHGRV
jgi:hypothetical protein